MSLDRGFQGMRVIVKESLSCFSLKDLTIPTKMMNLAEMAKLTCLVKEKIKFTFTVD